ncbi:universal stress protein [Plastorhodobacter daqingensis]|uniref:Universal stress protein n=1 Tax=Plastorhodobacter daqingensis TaxID=1387281 RepID=A0ABW2UDI6_9RHOB
MQKITAFIDGSSYAESVCDHAVWAASRLNMPVALVHVLGRRSDASSQPADLSGNLSLGARSDLMEKLARLDEERAALARERGRALLDDARARIGDGIEVSTRLRSGDLSDAVHELEPETRFAIIGKRGEAADFEKMHLGSNLDRLVRMANRPVLVVSRSFRPIESFLLAFDAGPSAQRAVERLAEGSVPRGTRCHILTVGDATPATRDRLSAAAAALRKAGYAVEEHLVQGHPEEAIARAVRETGADLLVLGKSGHSRLRQLFIGSTTLDLMRTCPVPVLIFP